MKVIIQISSLALFICLIMPLSATAEENLPAYDLSVSIEPESGRIKGTAKITLNSSEETIISMGKLKALSVLLNQESYDPEMDGNQFKIISPATLEIRYEGDFAQPLSGSSQGHSGHSFDNQISPDGISLTHLWYPAIETLARFRLEANVPSDFVAISEADEIFEKETKAGKTYTFHFLHPLDGIHLAADRYVIVKDSYEDIGVFGYFIEEDLNLAETYVNYAKQYLKMYEDLLGPYPFKRFSVVENCLPTGYSMPTFTLLGRAVVRLPFIVHTSLGHEVLHQWFGNLVFIKHDEGNWAEGLTTYLADHCFEERKQKGWVYRKNILTNYKSYVTPSHRFLLRDFVQRSDFASKTVGYGKCAMVFHMLKDVVGGDVFFDALRLFIKEKRFKEASWSDIRFAFEKASGKSLDWFFNQWLEREDVPRFEIKGSKVIYRQGEPTVLFEIVQDPDADSRPYSFDIKLVITTEEGEITKSVHISKQVETFEIQTPATPVAITFDPDYDLMRILSGDECPPVMSRLMGVENGIVVVGNKDRGLYSSLINMFEDMGFSVKSEDEIKDRDITSSSLLLIGKNSSIVKRLFGDSRNPIPAESVPNQDSQIKESGFTLSIKTHPFDSSKVVGIAFGTSEDEVSGATPKLRHYGRYSSVGFNRGKNIEKITDSTTRGITRDLRHLVRGIRPSKALGLKDIVDSIMDKPVIYVGESHTTYEDHRVQLEVIRRLQASGRKVAVGMEMFQRRFQNGLDNYMAGKINEKEFLRATEYFKQWKFDYRLYKEIIDFARSRQIPVIALNIDSNITRKVARGGLDSLSEEEKKQIPPDMDMSNDKYIQRLRQVFDLDEHQMLKKGNFYDFYQAQILWDETMAHSVDDFLSNNPDYQMVVLAGSGHLMYGSGIPERLKRLNGRAYSILINSNVGTVEDPVADFVLFPAPLVVTPSPRLGVFVKEVEEGMQVEDFPPTSIAKEAGLREEDIIVGIDDQKVKSIEDLKLTLFDKRPDDTLKVKIVRKKLLIGKKDMSISVTLP